MKKLLFILISVSIVSFSTQKMHADTIPDNSEIFGLWTEANSPYFIVGDVSVPENTTLTIEAGVDIRLKSSTNDSAFILQYLDVALIKVYGTIIAEGEETDSITFTKASDGKWGLMKFYNSSEGNIFNYCNISHAHTISDELIPGEGFAGAIGLFDSDAIIENSTIQDNTLGIYCSNSVVSIQNCEVGYNSEKGIVCFESISNIVNNHLYENGNEGIQSHTSISYIANNLIEGHLQGIHSYESADTISHNIVRNNLWGGIEITRDNSLVNNNLIYGSNSGIRCNGQPRLVNNTIVNNNYFGLYCDWLAKPIVINSIIFGNQHLINNNASDTVVIANCLIQANSFEPGLIDAGGNILNIDPLFNNPGNNDFSLSSSSPCIDMGSTFFEWEGDTILDLNPNQYYGLAPDMGSFESNFVYIEEKHHQDELTISPNPANSYISLSLQLDLPIEEALIYNHLGQNVLTTNPENNKIDVSRLNSGIYFIEVVTKEWRGKTKFIKQ